VKTIYRIFPSIGIARLGNSNTTYFLGPESPGIVPQGPYRDESSPGKIKPQATRFRVYEFRRDEFGEETVTRELIPNAKIRIKWSVHLVNRKAAAGQFPPSGPSAPPRNDGYDRAGLVIDAGVQSRSGKSKAALTLSGDINFIRDGNVEASERIQLGRILTDEKGRLIVVGGPGKSGSPISRGLDNFANNDGWYDGVSDGPVSALIEVADEEPVLAEGGPLGSDCPAIVCAWYRERNHLV